MNHSNKAYEVSEVANKCTVIKNESQIETADKQKNIFFLKSRNGSLMTS